MAAEDDSVGGREFYKVTKEDTGLAGIAVKTGVAVSRLRHINRQILIGGERVLAGQILRLTTPQKLAGGEAPSPPLVPLSPALSVAMSNLSLSPPAPPLPHSHHSAAATTSSSSSSTGKHHHESLPDPLLLGPKSDSFLLTVKQATHIRKQLPPTLHIENFVLLYSMANDGADFATFFRKVKGVTYTLLYVKSTSGEVFGGFAAAEWRLCKDFYGSGESFLFNISNEDDTPTIYKWSQTNPFFMFSSATQLAMGAEGDGFGLVLDADFASGSSNHCKTYNNPVLTREPGVIRIGGVEVWGFQRHIHSRKSQSPRSPRGDERRKSTSSPDSAF